MGWTERVMGSGSCAWWCRFCWSSVCSAPAARPNRCDVHVVAEDRTGGILPLRVESKEFGTSPVYLRFTESQKAQIFDHLAERCGFGTKQDPLNAP